jgi:hypothetical protein
MTRIRFVARDGLDSWLFNIEHWTFFQGLACPRSSLAGVRRSFGGLAGSKKLKIKREKTVADPLLTPITFLILF